SVVGWGQEMIPYVALGTSFTMIAAGGSHNLALKNDGTVVGWGYNGYGQTMVPAGLSNVVIISAGVYHSLALKHDGTVVAWGAGQTNGPLWTIDRGQSIVPVGLS